MQLNAPKEDAGYEEDVAHEEDAAHEVALTLAANALDAYHPNNQYCANKGGVGAVAKANA